MRYVRINSADSNHNHKKYERKCIAAADVRVDRDAKTAKTARRLNRAVYGEYSFEYSEGKLRRRFSFKSTVEFLKREAAAFYAELNKKTAAMTMAAASALALVLIFNINFSFGYNAFMGSTELGYVPSKSFVKECIESINDEFSMYVSGEDIINGKVAYVPAIIRRGSFTDAAAVEENIKSTSDVMVRAYAVEVDGRAYTALSNEAEAWSVLDVITAEYKTESTDDVAFKEDVTVLYEYVPLSILVTADYAAERLKGYTTLYNSVTVDGEIALADFAADNGLDAEYLKSLNPDLGEYITPTDKVVVPEWKPVVTVMTTDTVNYETPVPFEEQVSEDAELYEGSERIIRQGVNGVNAVTEKVERANGTIVNKTVISSEIVSTPVMQMRAVGTKERPPHVGTGSFMRPYYGTISSRFGSRRSGDHTGVDFCGSIGDPIVAADNGTVIFSGWSGGYGKVVKIDHNNGYITYYAHCNSLIADVGDVVQKGETIATVGNTGNSTGPHVHFEIRYGDDIYNPMNYVD